MVGIWMREVAMLKYLGDFASMILEPADPKRLPLTQQARQLHKELEALDLRDFEPAARFPLLRIRGQLAHFTETTGWSGGALQYTARELLPLLGQYRGRG